MSSFSDDLESKVLNFFFRNNADTYTPSAQLYIELYTVAPTDAGGGTVVTGGGYAREAVTFGAPTGTSPTTITNTGAVTFTATGSNYSAAVVAFGVFTAITGGDFLAWDDITSSTVNSGDTLNFAIGQISVTLT